VAHNPQFLLLFEIDRRRVFRKNKHVLILVKDDELSVTDRNHLVRPNGNV